MTPTLQQNAVSQLSAQADAIGKLAEDPGAFAATIAAFESNDPDALRWVLQRLELLPRCELICEWIRVKLCGLRWWKCADRRIPKSRSPVCRVRPCSRPARIERGDAPPRCRRRFLRRRQQLPGRHRGSEAAKLLPPDMPLCVLHALPANLVRSSARASLCRLRTPPSIFGPMPRLWKRVFTNESLSGVIVKAAEALRLRAAAAGDR